MANDNLGASFSIDVTDLKAGLAQANRMIRESESEFKAAAAGMDDWSKSQDGLEARISHLTKSTELQQKKVDALTSEYDRLIADGLDPTSAAATDLRTKINKEQEALNKNQKELQKQTDALDEMTNSVEDMNNELGDSKKELEKAEKALDDTGDAAEDAGKGMDGLKKAAGVAVGAVAAVGAACVAAVGSFLGLAESTRESRTQMAKLETAFTEAGHSAEVAEGTFTELYGALGDEGKAAEASAFLALMADNEEELAEQTHILTGVYATFGDSLPVEGLAEAMNHTAQLGTVQGNLADALEWSGVNVDDFNAQLATLNTEEERQELIVSTLNGLYGEAANKYKEVNADVIAAQEAQAAMNLALNDLGAIAEPIMTTLKNLATDLLVAITPFVQLIGEGLKGALEGADGAAEKLAEGLSGIITALLDKIIAILPFIIETIVAVVPKIITSLLAQLPAILQMLVNVVTQVIHALSAMLPSIVTAIMAVLPVLINALVSAVPQLIQAAITLLMAIVKALPTIISALITALPSVIDTIISAVLEAYPMLIDASIELLMACVDAIPTIISALVNALPKIISSLVNFLIKSIPMVLTSSIKLFSALIQAIPKMIPSLVKSIPQIISAIVSGLKDGISDITAIGKNIVEGLWNGIKNMGDWIAKKIKGFGESVLGGIKDFFGIKSPSKVMSDQVGKNLALGIGQGFEKNIGAVNKEITDALNFGEGNFGVNVKGNVNGSNSVGGGGVTVYQTNNYSQAHSRYEIYQSKQQTAAAVRLAVAGGV